MKKLGNVKKSSGGKGTMPVKHADTPRKSIPRKSLDIAHAPGKARGC